jgi:hypothetical protein
MEGVMRIPAKKSTDLNRALKAVPQGGEPFAGVAQLRQLNRQHNAARAQVRGWFDD